jgi:hypothetical protein
MPSILGSTTNSRSDMSCPIACPSRSAQARSFPQAVPFSHPGTRSAASADSSSPLGGRKAGWVDAFSKDSIRLWWITVSNPSTWSSPTDRV